MSETNYLWTIPLLPLLGAAINGLFGRNFSKKAVTAVALTFTAISFLIAAYAVVQLTGVPEHRIHETYAPWIAASGFNINFGLLLDPLSAVMILVVTGVGFLIHIYAVGYMAEEGGFYRFFAYLNLFMFFMLTLVLADNYLLMFVGWEGVGLASYLLIGFYFLKDSAANAGKKAFIVNRIGDFAFLLGMFLIMKTFGSLDFEHVFNAAAAYGIETAEAGVLTAIAILLLIGATGKSAQIPLYVWLPDAMEGPTPVSALIHAATMVTAGVYMVARSNILFSQAPSALLAVAIIGVTTAIFAASIGLVQNDIKRVLAYSTVSQLGYMFLACGVAAYGAAIFHLVTHAFFKALLFLSAGSVIHALAGEQDMRYMGGLRKKIPYTFWVMTVGTLAIAGTPLLSGFFSKDEILWRSVQSPYGSWWFWSLALLTAFMTSFYMFRLWFMTFFGERRGPRHDEHEESLQPALAGPDTHGAALPSGSAAHGHTQTDHADLHSAAVANKKLAHHASHAHATHAAGHGHGHGEPHESPWIMIVPLIILAVLSVVGGYIGVPHVLGEPVGIHNYLEEWLHPVFERADAILPPGRWTEHEAATQELTLTALSVVAAGLGFLLSWLLYYKRPELPARIAATLGATYRMIYNKYWVDEAYYAAFVNPIVNGSRSILWRGIDVGMIDAAVNEGAGASRSLGAQLRRMQSGNIRSYAGWVALGAALVIGYMLWLGGSR